ncbi:cytochrome P450 [Xylariales sp. PMI_506]|nr:cytochrome P450 [Xylariales sp. PMI_506]
MRKAHYVLGSLRFSPWLMDFLSGLPGGGGGDFAPFLRMCAEVVRERRAQHIAEKKGGAGGGGDGGGRKDVMAWLLAAMDAGSGGPPTEAALNAESRVMIAAGADTTQSALANALWYLAASPATMRRTQAVLDALFPDGPESFRYARLIASAEAVGWVDAVISETLRLRPPGVSGNPRVTERRAGFWVPAAAAAATAGPEQGSEVWIPGDTEVLVPTWVIQRDERWFGRPKEFIPERWLEGSPVLCDKAAYFPFNVGKHACVGKSLAMMELRSMVARVALAFDLEFPKGEDWEGYEDGIQDTFTMTMPPFHLIFKTRPKP